MSRRTINTDKAPAAIGPYSQAVVTRQMVYTAGQIGLDPATGKLAGDDIESQTRQVLSNLEEVLKEAGASFKDVVKTTIYVADMADFSKVNAVYKEKFGAEPPARSTIQAAALPLNALVEMDMIAALSGKETG